VRTRSSYQYFWRSHDSQMFRMKWITAHSTNGSRGDTKYEPEVLDRFCRLSLCCVIPVVSAESDSTVSSLMTNSQAGKLAAFDEAEFGDADGPKRSVRVRREFIPLSQVLMRNLCCVRSSGGALSFLRGPWPSRVLSIRTLLTLSHVLGTTGPWYYCTHWVCLFVVRSIDYID